MLRWRLLISAILIPVLVGLFVIDHKQGPRAPALLGLYLLLAARCVYEMVLLLRHRSLEVSLLLTTACTMTVVGSSWFVALTSDDFAAGTAALGPVALVVTVCVLVLMLKAALTFHTPGRSLQTLGAELFIVNYVGLLMAVTAQLRWVAGEQAGYLVLGSLLIAAKCGDIGAYTLGRLFGRRKMVPRLSPGKTWMGAVGAILGAGLAALLWLQLATSQFNSEWTACRWYWAVFYGAVIGTAGLIGDLCESLIKRDVGQKDSASLMPGFGGLLDLLDSILYAGPVAYLLWNLIPLQTW